MNAVVQDPYESEHSQAPSYVPSPTAEQFIAAAANGPAGELRMLTLMGSRGEGKTSAALIACLEVAERMHREGLEWALPLRVAVVRDTFENLKRTTLTSMREMASKGLPLQVLDGGHEAVITFDRPYCHFNLFGLDRPGDADKLQGYACGALLLEEVAPAAGLESGIPQEVLGLGVTSLRQPGVPWPRVLLPMNPPDQDAWILRVEEYIESLNITHIRVARYDIPPGEKSEHFRRLALEATDAASQAAWAQSAEEFDRYRERNQAFLESIGRHDLVARLVHGQVGEVQAGEPVVPWFSDEHVAKEEIKIYRALPILRFVDSGGSPACVFAQDLPRQGGLNILGSHTIENTHMEAFIQDWVLPFMRKYHLEAPREGATFQRGRRGGVTYRDICDPIMRSDGDGFAAGQVWSRMLGASLEPGPIGWEDRREALQAAFSRSVKGGRRFIQIDPTENDNLIKALKGRFRYPRDLATGRVQMTIAAAKRISGVFGQTPDALAYGLARLYPAAEWLRRNQQQAPPKAKPRGRTWASA